MNSNINHRVLYYTRIAAPAGYTSIVHLAGARLVFEQSASLIGLSNYTQSMTSKHIDGFIETAILHCAYSYIVKG